MTNRSRILRPFIPTIVYALFSFYSFHADARFITVEINQGNLSEQLIREAGNQGLTLLEPLDSPLYLAWIHDDTALKAIECTDTITINDTDFRPWMSVSDSTDTKALNGHFCFWLFDDPDEPNLLERQTTAPGITLLSRSTVKISEYVSYTVVRVRLQNMAMKTIGSWLNLRCFYRSSSSPVLEDELSVSSTLIGREKANQTHVFDTIADFGVNGARTKVGIIDTGCDLNQNEGNHPDLNTQIRKFITYPGSPGFDYVGHGTHMAGIIAGSGQVGILDSAGWNKGLGFSHRFGLTISDALLSYPFPPETGFAGLAADIAATGVHLVNNSWNDGEGTGVGYHPNCVIWDSIVKDALPDLNYLTPWPLTVVFSAGNQGPDPSSLTSPKEAKNIVTVGAIADHLTPGDPEILERSSRGPCIDGRDAPLVCAPGREITSCWPPGDYNAVSGTSPAAAHVTGAVGLIREWWLRHGGLRPSPALTRAILALSAIPIHDQFPSMDSGWGVLQVDHYQPEFPTASVLDEQIVFTSTNESWTSQIFPVDCSQPVDIVLAWTDAPGFPGANPALTNDLDLQVSSPEGICYGNVLVGGMSSPGGSADRLNNLERVRVLPTGSHPIDFSVKAHSIRGDGQWGNQDPTDQAFSLAVKNGILISDEARIHVKDTIAAGVDKIDVIATGKSFTAVSPPELKVTSTADRAGISVEFIPRFESPLVLQSTIHTGHRNRKNEISVKATDMVRLEIQSNSQLARSAVRIDGRIPQITEIEFDKITSKSVIINVTFDDICSAELHYKTENGSFWKSCTSPVLDSVHKFHIPDLTPVTGYAGFITARDTAGNLLDSRHYQQQLTWTTTGSQIIYSQFMNDDPGFVQLDGEWEWGNPMGNGSPPDPDSGKTGERVLGYDLNGNYNDRIEPSHAISSQIDCSRPGNYFLSFHRWLNVETGLFDTAEISVRDREMLWKSIWSNPYYDFREQSWTYQRYDVTGFASENDAFQFRFTMGYTDSAFNRSGWNIDDVVVEYEQYTVPTPTPFRRSDYPEIEVRCNGREFYPGESFILECMISMDSRLDDLFLVVTAKSDQSIFYYPGWSQQKDSVPIVHPGPGRYPVLIASFKVPELQLDSPYIWLTAEIYSASSPDLRSVSDSLPVRFRAR